MGQAKLRGTREQRVAEGIAKRKAREEEYRLRMSEYWSRLKREDRIALAHVIGMAEAAEQAAKPGEQR